VKIMKVLQFKPFVMPLRWRSFEDSAKWVTVGGGTNAQTGEGSGRHFQIDTDTGKILKGGGADMKGKTFKEAFNDPAKLSERQKTGRKISEAGAEKHGGNERDYRNLGTKTGQSDHFANKYLKTGDIPDGHLRDAVSGRPEEIELTTKQKAALNIGYSKEKPTQEDIDTLVANGFLEKNGNKYVATQKAYELNTKENERLNNPKNQKEAYSFHKQKLLNDVLQKDGKSEFNKKSRFIDKAESKFGAADILEFRKNDVVVVKDSEQARVFAFNGTDAFYDAGAIPIEDTVMGKFLGGRRELEQSQSTQPSMETVFSNTKPTIASDFQVGDYFFIKSNLQPNRLIAKVIRKNKGDISYEVVHDLSGKQSERIGGKGKETFISRSGYSTGGMGGVLSDNKLLKLDNNDAQMLINAHSEQQPNTPPATQPQPDNSKPEASPQKTSPSTEILTDTQSVGNKPVQGWHPSLILESISAYNRLPRGMELTDTDKSNLIEHIDSLPYMSDDNRRVRESLSMDVAKSEQAKKPIPENTGGKVFKAFSSNPEYENKSFQEFLADYRNGTVKSSPEAQQNNSSNSLINHDNQDKLSLTSQSEAGNEDKMMSNYNNADDQKFNQSTGKWVDSSGLEINQPASGFNKNMAEFYGENNDLSKPVEAPVPNEEAAKAARKAKEAEEAAARKARNEALETLIKSRPDNFLRIQKNGDGTFAPIGKREVAIGDSTFKTEEQAREYANEKGFSEEKETRSADYAKPLPTKTAKVGFAKKTVLDADNFPDYLKDLHKKAKDSSKFDGTITPEIKAYNEEISKYGDTHSSELSGK